MKTKTIISLIVAGLCLVAFPATSSAESQKENRDENGKIVRGPYLTNGFGDNWFVEFGVGPSIYLGGLNDNFGQRIRPVFDVNLGKWLTPSTGVRLSFNYGLKYKEFDADKEYSFNYWGIHGDFLWDLCNAIGGYRQNRVYHFIPFVGGGYAQCVDASYFNGHTNAFTLSAGIINKFRVCKAIDLNLEIRGTAASHNHDLISNSKTTVDAPVSVTAGITFKLGEKKFQRASAYAADQVAAAVAAKDAALAALAAEKAALAAENAELAKRPAEVKKDTVVLSENSTEFPPEVIVFFDLGKSQLNPKEDSHFQTFVYYVKQSIAAGKKVTLIGSADKQTGSAETNKRIAKDRAELVKRMLVTQYGISSSDLATVAEGGDNNRFQNQEMNRCVYIRF